MKNKIILTFDYELFLGDDSGNIYKTLIDPTNKILDILNKNNSKGLFFIDATFLLVIEELECFNIVKKQIKSMLKDGHDIGLHIHPHWKDAILTSECRWKFEEYKNFRLHSLSEEEIYEVVKQSYEALSKIAYEVDSSYKIDSFRAGGWSLQPFNLLTKTFIDLGIKYDFSVLPGIRDSDLPRHYYDYINYPKNKYVWAFQDDVTKEDKNGNFIEISNTTYDMNIIDLMKNRKLIKDYKIAGDGRGAARKKTFLEQLRRVRWSIKQIVSSDYIDYDIFKKYIHKIDREVIVYVAHPKLFSENSYKILEYMCNNFQTVKYNEVKI